MIEKFKSIKIKEQFKNPYLWISVISAVLLALNIDWTTFTSWELLWDAIVVFFSNPADIILAIGVILGIFNNNTTPGFGSPNSEVK